MKTTVKKVIFALAGTLAITSCGVSNSSNSGYSFSSSISSSDPIETLNPSKVKFTFKDFAKNRPYAIDYLPNDRNPKILVVPVWFTDSGNYIANSSKEQIRQDIYDAYFGDSKDVGWESVSSFYEKESNGVCRITGEVMDWFNVDMASKDVGDRTPVDIAEAAVKAYKEERGDMLEFDTDHNGYLDGVCMIYGAPNYMDYWQGNTKLWAFASWAAKKANKNVDDPGLNAFFFASFDYLYSRGNGLTRYGAGDTRFCRLDTKTYIHETGHLFGLSDYYDMSYRYIPAGGPTMQDHNVAGHDPFSLMGLGWADPLVLEKPGKIRIRPFQESHDILLLSPNYDGSPFDEYYLLEYYTPTGLNEFDSLRPYMGYENYQAQSEPGIRVWHVDARLLYVENEYATSFSIKNLTTNPLTEEGLIVDTAFTNSYFDGEANAYCTRLGQKYGNYNLLQNIRNNRDETYVPTASMKDDDLFVAGDRFTVDDFASQSVNGYLLNSGKLLGYGFAVESLTDEEAIIDIFAD